ACKLLAGVGRLFVVAGEENYEVTRVFDGLVHFLDEARAELKIVVLDADLVALLSEDVGGLLPNSGPRAATGQEEVVPLTGTAWHGGTLVLSSDGHAQNAGRQGRGGQTASPHNRGGTACIHLAEHTPPECSSFNAAGQPCRKSRLNAEMNSEPNCARSRQGA